jgi:Sporulation and spore germination
MAERLEVAAVIPKYQKIIVWLLLIGCVLIAAYLIRMRGHAQDQLAAVPDAAPMPAPVESAPVSVTFLIANDEDSSLAPLQEHFALPAEQTTRARGLLNDLFATYAQPGSPHPLPAVTAINDVFLLPVPGETGSPDNKLAVINFSSGFTDRHPSGILVETLTLLSILGTLRANMPQITEVRFLVDGKPKDTLAGHADLMRTYLTGNDVPIPATAAQSQSAGAPSQPGAPH